MLMTRAGIRPVVMLSKQDLITAPSLDKKVQLCLHKVSRSRANISINVLLL